VFQRPAARYSRHRDVCATTLAGHLGGLQISRDYECSFIPTEIAEDLLVWFEVDFNLRVSQTPSQGTVAV